MMILFIMSFLKFYWMRIQKSINFEDDNEVLEAIVDDDIDDNVDDEMEKDRSSASEACVTPVVTKDVEMTPVGKSFSKNKVLSHLSELEITALTAETYDPICQACLLCVPETVDHLLRRCPGRTIARRKHLGPNSRATIEDLCTKYPMHVLRFLLDEGLLRDPSPSKFG